MPEVYMVYMTAGSDAEARTIAGHLVEHRLAACVNILGAVHSVYRWQGVVEEGTEVAMVAKTTAEGVEPLERAVKALHSYECPCIVAWPLAAGHGPFLDWVREQTGGGMKPIGKERSPSLS